MLITKTLKVYADSPEIAKKIVEEEYEKKGFSNITINFVELIVPKLGVPKNIRKHLDSLCNYKVQISYEEEMIDTSKLIQTRAKAIELQKKIAELQKVKEQYLSQLGPIQDNCKHKVIVKLQKWDFDGACNDAYCLECNSHFNGPGMIFDSDFENIIHFEDLKDMELTSEKKMKIALKMFTKFKTEKPELSDSDIVEMINKQVKENRDSVKDYIFTQEKIVGIQQLHQEYTREFMFQSLNERKDEIDRQMAEINQREWESEEEEISEEEYVLLEKTRTMYEQGMHENSLGQKIHNAIAEFDREDQVTQEELGYQKRIK